MKNNGNVKYKQSFKTNDTLPSIEDKSEFQDHINKSKNKYAVSFPNLSKDAMLVIPIPMADKNFSTLRDFIDNAEKIQQQELWKKVAQVAKEFMNNNDKVWISVNGQGVPYTHIRISSVPKYYFDKELQKE